MRVLLLVAFLLTSWFFFMVEGLAQTTLSSSEADSQFGKAYEPITSSERVFSKRWVLGALLPYAGASAFDGYKTISDEGACALEGNNGFPERVSAKEIAVENSVEFAGVTLLMIPFRLHRAPRWARWLSYSGPAYGTALHLRGGINWTRRCG